MDSPITISSLSGDEAQAHLKELAGLLHACVHDGASISFVLPFTIEDATTFWAKSVLPQVRAGTRVLLVARQAGVLAGSVQLDHDTPPNQPHRAEVRKLIVHPDFRRRGIARALMAELETIAAKLGRSLITLDTRTGDTAEPLYASMGYTTAGVIPGYARDPAGSRLDATTVMYKGI
ncbi:MAG TPA: GNAT family N-acetyltransferase [Saliniramus sp.]|nr:GNAT family N-acetyltransferase [Saliniramus sp.]